MTGLCTELIEFIIDELSDDKASLRACALVSPTTWLPRAQHHLFRTVRIDGTSQCERFSSALSVRPALGLYVHELKLTQDYCESWFNIPPPGGLVKLVDRMPRVKHLRIRNMYWNQLPAAVRACFLSGRFSREAQSLRLSWCTFDSDDDFLDFLHAHRSLSSLEITDGGWLQPSGVSRESKGSKVSLRTLKAYSLWRRTHMGEREIHQGLDFTHLTSLGFSFYNNTDLVFINMVLKEAQNSLQHIRFHNIDRIDSVPDITVVENLRTFYIFSSTTGAADTQRFVDMLSSVSKDSLTSATIEYASLYNVNPELDIWKRLATDISQRKWASLPAVKPKARINIINAVAGGQPSQASLCTIKDDLGGLITSGVVNITVKEPGSRRVS